MDVDNENEESALYLPGSSLQRCNKQDLTMKGSKKASKFQFLTILPAHLGVMKSFEGKVGYLENINSAVPKFVIDTSEGQLVFDGRMVRTSTSFFTVDCVPSNAHSQISNLFRDVLVFGGPRLVPKIADSAMATEEDLDVEEGVCSLSAVGVTSSSSPSSSSEKKDKEKEIIYAHGISQRSDKSMLPQPRLQLSQLSQTSVTSNPRFSQAVGDGDGEEEEDEGAEYDSDDEGDDEADDEVQFLSMGSDSEGSAMEGRRSARKAKRHNYAEAGDEEDDEQDEEEMAVSLGSDSEQGLDIDTSRESDELEKPAAGKSKARARGRAEAPKVTTVNLLDDSASSGFEADEHEFGTNRDSENDSDKDGDSDGDSDSNSDSDSDSDSSFGGKCAAASKKKTASTAAAKNNKMGAPSETKKPSTAKKEMAKKVPNPKLKPKPKPKPKPKSKPKPKPKPKAAAAPKKAKPAKRKASDNWSDDDEASFSSLGSYPPVMPIGTKRAKRDSSSAQVTYTFESSDDEGNDEEEEAEFEATPKPKPKPKPKAKSKVVEDSDDDSDMEIFDLT